MFQKKGAFEVSVRVIIILVLIVFLTISIMAGIFQKTSRTAFANEFFAKDIALVIEALYSVPGDVVMDYSQDLGNRTVDINKGIVTVYIKGKEVSKMTAHFIESENIKINYGKFEPEKDGLQLRFIKTSNSIEVTKDVTKMPDFSFLNCPLFSTKNNNWKDLEILVDISHRDDDNDLGYVSGELKESEIVEKIAEYFKYQQFSNLEFTREIGVNLVGIREEKITAETGAIISLNVGSYTETMNEIRAYINPHSLKAKESNKLACVILNAIKKELKDTKITSLSIIPAKEGSPNYRMLSKDKIAVSLEIGNIQNTEGKKMLYKTAEIGKGIYQGLQDYYS